MKTMTMAQALNSALDLAMAGSDKVFLMGEDIGRMGGDFGVTKGLWDKYGEERVRDTPLSEAGFIGAAVGAAMVGMRPVAEIMFADFMGECYDQMVNNAAKMHYMFDGQFKAPIVVRTATGGGFGGGPHHSQSVEGWFLNVPGLVIVAPSNPYDAKGLLLASIENDNPVPSWNIRRSTGPKARCRRRNTPSRCGWPASPAPASTSPSSAASG
jgi:acetoin:2,6-dichlorophenolindophenol oxidoreductase subunit beta